jgi:hypothetical protein
MEEQLDEMRQEMDTVTKHDGRSATLNQLNYAFDNLSGFINGVQTQQKRTVITLKKLEALM